MRDQRRAHRSTRAGVVVLAIVASTLLQPHAAAAPAAAGDGRSPAATGAAPDDPWVALRLAADSLEHGSTSLASPPSYMQISGPYGARLMEALRYRRAGREREAADALDDCRAAGRLAAELYEGLSLPRTVERVAGLTPDRARSWVEGDSLTRLGSAAYKRGDYPAARQFFLASGARAAATADDLLLVRAMYDTLQPQICRLEPAALQDSLGQVARQAERLGSPGFLAQVLARKIALHRPNDPLGDLLKDCDELGRLGTRLREPKMRGYALQQRNQALLAAARFAEARDLSRSDLAQSIALSDSIGMHDALTRIGSAFFEEGRMDSASVYGRQALQISERQGNRMAATYDAYNVCLQCWYQFNTEEALRYCEQARDLAQEQELPVIEGEATNIVGNITAETGAWRNAFPLYRRALALARETNNRTLVCYALANIGFQYCQLDSMEIGKSYLHAAIAAYDSVPPPQNRMWDLKGLALANLGLAADWQGDSEEAFRLTEEAYAMARTSSDSTLGLTSAGLRLARYLLRRGDLNRAAEVGRSAYRAATTRGDRNGAIWARTDLAWIAWSQGRRQEAADSLDAAIRDLEIVREAQGAVGSREDWFASQIDPFEYMVRLQVALGDSRKALAYFERMKARELLDLLENGPVAAAPEVTAAERAHLDSLDARIRELNLQLAGGDLEARADLGQARETYDNFCARLYRLHPELRARQGHGKPIEPKDAGRLLAPDEIALLYSVSSDSTALLAVTRDEVRGFVLGLSRPILQRQAEILLASANNPDMRFARETAEALYKGLVAPAGDLLQGKHRICVVPDEQLYSIPFGLLCNPQTGAYLADEMSIRVVPSLSTLEAQRLKGSRNRRSLLALADPDLGPQGVLASNERGAFGRLPFSRAEVDSIATAYAPEATLLTGSAATEAAVKSQAAQYGVLHLATHGLLDDDNPLYSSILLTPGGAGEDGFLEAREVMGLRLNTDLVVLSACETARGKITRGEGINGLTRAFFVAGVPTVVASLWPVEDESTALLMARFHRNLRSGAHPAEALATAQRDLRALDPRLSHPYFWAGFQIYGDSE